MCIKNLWLEHLWNNPLVICEGSNLLEESRVPPTFATMSVEGPNKRPMRMASRQWSANTLAAGVTAVMSDVKAEPWHDATDDELKERLKARSLNTSSWHIGWNLYIYCHANIPECQNLREQEAGLLQAMEANAAPEEPICWFVQMLVFFFKCVQSEASILSFKRALWHATMPSFFSGTWHEQRCAECGAVYSRVSRDPRPQFDDVNVTWMISKYYIYSTRSSKDIRAYSV